MKKSTCILFVLFSLLFFIQSCKEKSTTPANDDDYLYPLKIGNYWTISELDYDSQGNLNDVINMYSIHVWKDSTYNNEKIYKVSSSQKENDGFFIYWLNRKDGFYDYDILNNYTEPRLRLKYPAKEGDWFWFEGDTMLVDQINIEYTVPAGTFKCYKYVCESEGSEVIHKTIHYCSPGIGFVATENYYQDEYSEMYLESKLVLIEYKVK